MYGFYIVANGQHTISWPTDAFDSVSSMPMADVNELVNAKWLIRSARAVKLQCARVKVDIIANGVDNPPRLFCGYRRRGAEYLGTGSQCKEDAYDFPGVRPVRNHAFLRSDE